jgi:hypothetical protein
MYMTNTYFKNHECRFEMGAIAYIQIIFTYLIILFMEENNEDKSY